jgi:hypothetical protein
VMDVTKWIGNSPTVAAKHYHPKKDETIEKVTGKCVHKCVQSVANMGSQGQSTTKKQSADDELENAEKPIKQGVLPMARAGFEPATPAFSVQCSTN